MNLTHLPLEILEKIFRYSITHEIPLLYTCKYLCNSFSSFLKHESQKLSSRRWYTTAITTSNHENTVNEILNEQINAYLVLYHAKSELFQQRWFRMLGVKMAIDTNSKLLLSIFITRFLNDFSISEETRIRFLRYVGKERNLLEFVLGNFDVFLDQRCCRIVAETLLGTDTLGLLNRIESEKSKLIKREIREILNKDYFSLYRILDQPQDMNWTLEILKDEYALDCGCFKSHLDNKTGGFLPILIEFIIQNGNYSAFMIYADIQNIYSSCENGWKYLRHAASSPSNDILIHVLSNMSKNKTQDELDEALISSCINGSLANVRLLVETGADPLVLFQHGYTDLIWKNKLSCLRYLMDKANANTSSIQTMDEYLENVSTFALTQAALDGVDTLRQLINETKINFDKWAPFLLDRLIENRSGRMEVIDFVLNISSMLVPVETIMKVIEQSHPSPLLLLLLLETSRLSEDEISHVFEMSHEYRNHFGISEWFMVKGKISIHSTNMDDIPF